MKRRRPREIHDQLQMDEGEEQDLDIGEIRPRRRSGRRKLINRLIPIVMIGFMAIVVLRQEIPAFNDFFLSNSDPQGFAAIKACRDAALENATVEQYKRLIRHGESHLTADGYFVDKIVLGQLGADGGESRVAVTCHVDTAGVLVDITRKRLRNPPDSNNEFETGSAQTTF